MHGNIYNTRMHKTGSESLNLPLLFSDVQRIFGLVAEFDI